MSITIYTIKNMDIFDIDEINKNMTFCNKKMSY